MRQTSPDFPRIPSGSERVTEIGEKRAGAGAEDLVRLTPLRAAPPEFQERLELGRGHSPEAAAAAFSRRLGVAKGRRFQAGLADQLAQALDADPTQLLGDLL